MLASIYNLYNLANIDKGGERMPTVYIRDFPEDLHIRAKIQALKEKTTLKELTIKALEQYLKKVGG